MVLQEDTNDIRWRLHLKSPPEMVYWMLATDEGRACFWAEAAQERDGMIDWRWPGGQTARTRVLDKRPPVRFAVEYYGGSTVTFDLAGDAHGGTVLTMTDSGVRPEWHTEVAAGWVSVLMALKAAVDFNVDLRNHSPEYHWDNGFVDN